MDKIKIKEALVVEGRYDKNTLSQIVDAPIFVTDGFGLFKDPELLTLLRSVAEKRGLIVLTDPDGAGLVIRNRLKGAIPPEWVKHAYVPDVPGKERRKAAPGKEGKLGVEGMEPEVLIAALRNAGATFLDEAPGAAIGRPHEATGSRQQATGDGGARQQATGNRHQASGDGGREATGNRGRGERGIRHQASGDGGREASGNWQQATGDAAGALIERPHVAEPIEITKTDLYELGLSGKPDSKEKRKALQKALGLPENLSPNALLTALNCLYTKPELEALLCHPESSTWRSPAR